MIETYLKEGIDFLSIDIEGDELALVKALDLSKYRPAVICLETAVYMQPLSVSLALSKTITEYMEENHYILYANTAMNSIYFDQKRATEQH